MEFGISNNPQQLDINYFISKEKAIRKNQSKYFTMKLMIIVLTNYEIKQDQDNYIDQKNNIFKKKFLRALFILLLEKI